MCQIFLEKLPHLVSNFVKIGDWHFENYISSRVSRVSCLRKFPNFTRVALRARDWNEPRSRKLALRVITCDESVLNAIEIEEKRGLAWPRGSRHFFPSIDIPPISGPGSCIPLRFILSPPVLVLPRSIQSFFFFFTDGQGLRFFTFLPFSFPPRLLVSSSRRSDPVRPSRLSRFARLQLFRHERLSSSERGARGRKLSRKAAKRRRSLCRLSSLWNCNFARPSRACLFIET